MIALYRNILRLLNVVNVLKDGQAVPNTGYTHCLEIIVEQGHESFADNLVLYIEAQPRMLDQPKKQTEK